eukprot:TRINITY_DN7780_c0_g1_i1.p1 TRINITY_DN7780_c0_g1~~TRINITY_DN7780_c0_g1_i1.p1  ORF type:complete len:433 (-),score=73.35 TRINITY_DN7780_c0_g1_i1:11-1309(-)
MASVEGFFVFSDKFGATEDTEDEKVLFYWPEDAPPNDKMNNVGMCQGIVGFTQTFNPDGPVSAIHTEKRALALYHPDPDTWVVLLVRKQDGSPELTDLVLQYTVQQAYRMFRLFHGSFDYILQNFKVRTLRDKLELFFPHYLQKLDIAKLNFFSGIDGIHFLPVDKNVYLQIYCFINHLENTFTQVKHTCFLYDDHLVWTGVDQDDMRVLYRYLASYLHSEEPGSAQRLRTADQPLTSCRGRTGFLTGPEDMTDKDTPVNAPQVYVGTPLQQLVLVVYQYQRITVLLLMDPAAAVDLVQYQQLSGFIEGQLRPIVPAIAEQYDRQIGAKEEFKYIYFNHMNLAMKMSLRKQPGQPLLPKDLLQLVTSIHTDFQTSDGIKEVCLRHQDGWVVGRKSGQREFFVLFDKREASLVQVGEDVQKLCETYFGNIFIE